MAFLDNTGLSHFWQHVLALADGLTPKSRKINGKSLDTDITITATDLGLEQAMKFLGTTVSNISDASNLNTIIIGDKTIEVEAGNVVLYGGYEYVWDGDAWEQLGQEGSFALKSVTINAEDGLTGGGNLSNNITIKLSDETKSLINNNVNVQTDWNENDSSSDAYVKNKTHYIEKEYITGYEGEANLNSLSLNSVFSSYKLPSDTKIIFKIRYNNQNYSTAFTSSSSTINISDGGSLYTLDIVRIQYQIQNPDGSSASVLSGISVNSTTDLGVISITLQAEKINYIQLDEAYIPDTIARNNLATSFNNGLMSAADKIFVDGVQSQIDGKMNATNPTGSGSLSIGRKADTTVGENSIALGTNATAIGKNSVAIGNNTSAGGDSSFAEGNNTTAYGLYSHAEGWNTEAMGAYSHTEGYNTFAQNDGGHSEGSDTQAHGMASHAEGWTTIANGVGAHAEGFQTQTLGGDGSHAQGKWNLTDTIEIYAHVVGNGDSVTRSNAHTLDWSGNAWFSGDVYVGSTSGTNKDEGSVKLATITEVPTIEIVRW